MDWRDIALMVAGLIGSAVAVIHGVLVQRLMVRPMEAVFVTDRRISGPIRRLTSPLLQFSTFNWFLGGLALIVAANWLDRDARLVTAVLVGSSYLFGAIGNLWATRGRHPGWALYSVAFALIVVGASGSGA